MGKQARDLTGIHFGKLLVIKRVESHENRPYWLCKCDCGSEVIAKSDILTRKKEPKISCGCAKTKRIDMAGQRFGRLLIIKGLARKKWECLCDCGNKTEVLRSSLVLGLTTSCGCFAVEKFRNFVKNNIGPKHHNFNPDKKDRINLRKYYEYTEWRKLVFKKDDFSCCKCGLKGIRINAHHIENFSSNEDKRVEINNGITLCQKCHKQFHSSYGQQNNNKDQLIEFGVSTDRLMEQY